jgi:SAM-dependent methyltransferase
MAVDWNHEWEVTWKAHPGNPWFQYQADVYCDWLGPVGPIRVLKTDAFDEACGFAPFGAAAAGARVVYMDVSPRILAAARDGGAAPLACATDARRLAFRPGVFELVFSPSTLDHFDDPEEIARAVAELSAALRPGGRLLVTLDNLANPILRLRAAVHRRTGSVGGLIPFAMGCTLSRRALTDVVTDAGLQVLESGYLLHTPRAVGLWLGEWAARGGHAGTARGLRTFFGRFDRVAAALPSRRWTGHFVVADCYRPTGPLRSRKKAPIPFALNAYLTLSTRMRSAYVRALPAPLLARIDPPLRRALTVARQAAALPFYLRQRLADWSGRCGGEPARVALWGKPGSPRQLLDVLFDGEPSSTWKGAVGLPRFLRDVDDAGAGADLLLAETTPALAGAFVERGFLIVPGMMRAGADIETLLATLARPSSSLASDLARIRRTGYRTEIWSHTRARSQLAYRRYLVPHAYTRFQANAWVPDFEEVDRLFAAGLALTVTRPGAAEPDALGIFVLRGRLLWFVLLGTRDADPAVLAAGGLAALYEALIRLAHERGMRRIDAGRCRPWRTDGVLRFKWKWGFRPITDTAQTLEYAVKVLRPESAPARRLAQHGVIVRAGRRFLVMGPDGRLGAG